MLNSIGIGDIKTISNNSCYRCIKYDAKAGRILTAAHIQDTEILGSIGVTSAINSLFNLNAKV